MAKPTFLGDRDDLTHFIELASTPVHSEQRERALRMWEEYKLARHVADARSKGAFAHSRMLADHNRVVDLRGAWLDGICAGTVDMRGVRLDGASLRGAWLKGAQFRNASLRSADFSPLEGDRAVPDSMGWGSARLGFADFIDADMEGVILNEASLTGANLRGVRLNGARLVGADLTHANLTGADLRDADLRGASLEGATLTGAKLQRANLCRCRVYGLSAWDVELDDDDTLYRDLVLTPQGQPEATVDSIELAQFVYLLLTRPKIRDVLETVSKKAVLILGRFGGGGLEMLHSIGDGLREAGYVPMVFDFARPRDRTYTETVLTLAGIARFVVVDLSGPSVPHELHATVSNLKIPFVPILEKGKQPYPIFGDLLENDCILKPVVEFESLSDLLLVLRDKIIGPAERRVEARRSTLNDLYSQAERR